MTAPLPAKPYVAPDLSSTVPLELRHLPQTYWGAATHEFVSSIVEARRPTIDAMVAADWTAAGLAAHKSAMSGGAVVEIERFVSPSTTR
jgi:hypothetical protein